MSESTSDTQSLPVFVPLLLLAFALFLMTAFQAIQLSKERDLLSARLQAQAEPVQESTKVREQLQSIATGTATLAESGNENARQIMDLLKRSGVSINADNNQPAETDE